MFEKVNPSHPDKVADRIAGALVDLAYEKQKDPKIAVEVLVGHGVCHIIAETSVELPDVDVRRIVYRIAGEKTEVDFKQVPQDAHLSANQKFSIRCGDNGIFKGAPVSAEEKELSDLARVIYQKFPTDGKYIINGKKLIVCQSHAEEKDILRAIGKPADIKINPLGYWTGGPDVDSGATNRKLGSDMAQSVTGGGLHGKDLSKADVSVNIYAFAKAQVTGKPVEMFCAIGDDEVNGVPYADIVEFARSYIDGIGGFEKFAEWGLV